VALKDFLTSWAELRPILLKALLHRRVIAQLLSAKTRGVAGAGLLLLRRTHMAALGETCRGAGKNQRHYKKHISHSEILCSGDLAPRAIPAISQ
jgi:hypothetical protein